jgi:hypothetical protein
MHIIAVLHLTTADPAAAAYLHIYSIVQTAVPGYRCGPDLSINFMVRHNFNVGAFVIIVEGNFALI